LRKKFWSLLFNRIIINDLHCIFFFKVRWKNFECFHHKVLITVYIYPDFNIIQRIHVLTPHGCPTNMYDFDTSIKNKN
jgi:hypothetical protein